jgi:hypothetical protein
MGAKKRLIQAAGALVLCAAALCAEEKDYYAALKDLREENAVLAFVRSEIESAGGKFSVHDFSGFSGGHSFSYIIQAAVSGLRPDTLIVAAPAVSSGSSFSAALALSLWRRSLASPPPVSLLFLFLGGDGESGFSAGGSREFPRRESLGTRLFLDSFFSEYPAAVLYLNFTEPPGAILCETGTRGIVSPSWMIRAALGASGDSALDFRIPVTKNRMHRLRISGGGSPAGEYLAAGIPAIGLENAGPGEGSPISGENLAAFFTGYLEQLGNGIPPEWDRFYLLFPWGKSFRVIGESVLIILLFGVLGASFLYALIARRRVERYVRTFLRNIWNLPLILLLLTLFFMAGTLLVRAVSALRGAEELWRHHPFVFFLLKTGAAVFLLILAFHHLRRFPFSKNGSFYSASAIFFFFANALVFSAIDIAFRFYFLWAYCAAILFSLWKRRVLKFVFLFLSPLLFCVLAIDTFFAPDTGFAGVLINSPVTGNFFLGFIFFPFFLMLIRMDLLFRRPHRERSSRAFKILLGLSAALTALAASYALIFNPWKDTPQPLAVEEYIDAEEGVHELRLSSSSALGDFVMLFGQTFFPVDTGARALRLPLEAPAAGIPRAIQAEDFLARRTYAVTLNPPLTPAKITLSLSSDSPLVVYDANFPYSLEASGRRAEVFIGENPPLPLRLILTFPAEQNVRAEIRSWSASLSSTAGSTGKAFRETHYSKTRDSFIIKGDG